jgi:hypothetical protein
MILQSNKSTLGNFMKKTFSTLFIGAVALAIPALAGVEELNNVVKNLLVEFNNPVTVAELKFANVEVNAERAVSINASGLFRKLGSENTLEIKVDEFSYNYGDGTAPVTKIKASFGIDLLKIVDQKSINELAPTMDEMVKGFAENFTQQYGDAVTIDAKITDKQVTEAGDLVSITIHLAGKLDLAKLPAEKPASDEVITEGSVDLKIGVSGIALELSTISNPAYKGFAKDETGMKEILEKLLALDEGQLTEIKEAFSSLDRAATEMTNTKKKQ